MRILIASDPGANPYVGSLVCALNELPEVTSVMSGAILFWMHPRNVDVLHIQWPEVLFPGGRDPSVAELQRLDRQLAIWNQHACVVATVHNRMPHWRRTQESRQLFATIYQHCDGVIHLGERSMDAFKEDHGTLRIGQHAVIPHINYSFFENTVSKANARRWLGIEQDRTLVLAFGQLRFKEEWRLLIQAFRKFKAPRKTLLIAGRVFCPSHRLLKLYHHVQRALGSPVIFHNHYIPDTDVQHYLNAADILLIPRSDQLNSGNVPLGFTFGKIVVGPRTGVMGELLLKHGNPTYIPEDARSCAEAMGAAMRLVGTTKAADNRRVAFEEWGWTMVAEAHLASYRKMMENRNRSLNEVGA